MRTWRNMERGTFGMEAPGLGWWREPSPNKGHPYQSWRGCAAKKQTEARRSAVLVQHSRGRTRQKKQANRQNCRNVQRRTQRYIPLVEIEGIKSRKQRCLACVVIRDVQRRSGRVSQNGRDQRARERQARRQSKNKGDYS